MYHKKIYNILLWRYLSQKLFCYQINKKYIYNSVIKEYLVTKYLVTKKDTKHKKKFKNISEKGIAKCICNMTLFLMHI